MLLPTRTSSGHRLLLPLELQIDNYPSRSCCTSGLSDQLTSLAGLPEQPHTWPLTAAETSRQGRYCACSKTALHLAIKQGRLDKVERLLSQGASLAAKDGFGKLPIHYCRDLEACDSRRVLDLVWLRLMEEPEEREALRRASGLTAIHLACLRDDHWAAGRLLSHTPSLVHSKAHLSCSRWPGYSALHFAVCHGSQELLQLLLGYEADLEDRDKFGHTPALLAIGRANVDFFHWLVSRGADPYARTYRCLTALRLALQTDCESAIEAVLEYTRANPMDNKGSTALHYCCEKALYGKVIEIMEQGIDPDTRTHLFAPRMPGYAPLHVAVERKDTELMRLLLENEASVEQMNAELMSVVEMVHCRVQDERMRLQMLEIIKEYEIGPLPDKPKFLLDKLDCMIDNAHDNMDEPVVIEVDSKYDEVAEMVRSKLAFKKCIAMSRMDMSSLFLRYGDGSNVVRISVAKNGKLRTKLIYGSFRQQAWNGKGKSARELVYDYYVVNDVALKALINFGLDLGNHTSEIILGNAKNVPKSLIYAYLRHMEVRRLLGLGGRNADFWKDKIVKEIPEPFDYYTEDLKRLPDLVSREVESMKRMQLGSSTLFDLLRDLSKLARFLCVNPYFVQLLHAQEFADRLPNCMSVVRLQCCKAIERRKLVGPATRRLSEIVEDGYGVRWLDDCSDFILPYLDNEDLKNLIMV